MNKPDFEKLAYDHLGESTTYGKRDAIIGSGAKSYYETEIKGMIAGMEKIWNNHVEALLQDNKALRGVPEFTEYERELYLKIAANREVWYTTDQGQMISERHKLNHTIDDLQKRIGDLEKLIRTQAFYLRKIALADNEMIQHEDAAIVYRGMVRAILVELDLAVPPARLT